MKLTVTLTLALIATLALTACGFHLRRSAALPAGMQRVHLEVSGSNDFERALARAIEASGSTVVDDAGPGVAVLHVPTAAFDTNALTITGAGRISEYAVRFHVRFDVTGPDGKTLVQSQDIRMSREYTYDASHSIGSGTQAEALRQNLVRNMVRAVMSRLQAAAQHPAAAASAAGAASVPAG